MLVKYVGPISDGVVVYDRERGVDIPFVGDEPVKVRKALGDDLTKNQPTNFVVAGADPEDPPADPSTPTDPPAGDEQ